MYGSFLHIAPKAGRNGVIARRSWKDQVVLVRDLAIEGSQVRTTLIVVSEYEVGNFNPAEEDLQATDWCVVSTSTSRFPKFESK